MCCIYSFHHDLDVQGVIEIWTQKYIWLLIRLWNIHDNVVWAVSYHFLSKVGMANTISSVHCLTRVRCNVLINLLNPQQDSRGHLHLNQPLFDFQLQPVLKLSVSSFSPISIVYLYYLQTLTESALL